MCAFLSWATRGNIMRIHSYFYLLIPGQQTNNIIDQSKHVPYPGGLCRSPANPSTYGKFLKTSMDKLPSTLMDSTMGDALQAESATL